jgi:aspartate racemase
MKTIGIIGGLSWFSTSIYYSAINQLVNERLGGSHSAKILLYSVDFNDFDVLQKKNDWHEIEQMMAGIALKLETAGAGCIVMATNTPHLIAEGVRQKIKIPLLHIAEATAKEIAGKKMSKAGLLGTKFTMENSFFRDKLSASGISTLIPGEADRDFIHTTIFNELTKGVFKSETRSRYLEIISRLQEDGAEGIIFGCTEIALLIKPDDCSFPVFDTARIHIKAAVDFALAD